MVRFLKDYQFTFDTTSSYIPFKRKQDIRRKIVENGGTVSYILNNKTNFVISEDVEIASTYKGRTALKLGIPVVSLSFVDDCAEKQKLLDSDQYRLVAKSSVEQFSSGVIRASDDKMKEVKKLSKSHVHVSLNATSVYQYKNDQNELMPKFPNDYEIVKHSWFKKTEKDSSCCFVSHELHVAQEDSENEEKGPKYRIFTHTGILEKNGIKDDKKECRFAVEAERAVELYRLLCGKQSDFNKVFSPFPPWIGSDKIMLAGIESQSFEEGQNISPEVCSLVHCLWAETVGELSSLLSCPVEKIKLEDVTKAEAALFSLRKLMNDPLSSVEERLKLSAEFYSLIPHKDGEGTAIDSKRMLVKKQDLCQLIKDMLNINEATSFSLRATDAAKYRALRCHLEVLSESCDEYQNILNRIQSTERGDPSIKVNNIFTVHRPIEAHNFRDHGTHQLFHSSRAENMLGILSRGLLLPKLVVEDYGGQRTDIGHLGTGIYFADDADVSAKYSYPGHMRGSRFMLICKVSLGNYKDYTKFTTDLNGAPEGFHSCHGVGRHHDMSSDFEDDEYAVYDVNQQMIRHLVEFTLPEDKVFEVKPLDDSFNREDTLVAPINPVSLDEQEISDTDGDDSYHTAISEIENIEDPLSKVKAGLQCDGDTIVPLKSVHIRAKLLDLCARVVVMQVYENPKSEPIEAKYVFPLDDMAAVCGFEAFINGKHIIGEVKEKEQAHKEYKKAISEGHGAYLMDEESPDVFTVSVGNIPAGATVIIKISYVAELPVEGDDIKFHLPGSLAPWKRDQALQDATQNTFDTVAVEDNTSFDLSIHVAVEMPFDIRTIECPTHQIKIKKTAAKAVVEMEKDQVMDDGFQLLIRLAEIHVPRMWVEKHPEKSDSQACMLSFYPEFEAEPTDVVEIIFLLDLSCSMKGAPLEDAKKVLLLTLNNLPENAKFNIIAFGGVWFELFATSVTVTEDTLKEAYTFVKHCRPNLGASDLWKTLKALSVLPVSCDVRNIFVISDGHLNEEETTLSITMAKKQHSRVFTFGVGSSANRYLLRTLSTVGAGASEYFDSKQKSKWKPKVQSQLSKCEQPVLTCVSVAWQQYDNDPPQPIQAPNQIMSLFNGCRQVVYGFVPFCTQATLHAEVNGKKISTMVSTSELCIKTGKILHQLTARALINDWESGTLGEDHVRHQAVKRESKDYIIEISKEYSVTSKFTSFVAIERRDESEEIDPDTVPNVQEILDDENVDILPYIGWKEDSEKEIKTTTEEKDHDEMYGISEVYEDLDIMYAASSLHCTLDSFRDGDGDVEDDDDIYGGEIDSKLTGGGFFDLLQDRRGADSNKSTETESTEEEWSAEDMYKSLLMSPPRVLGKRVSSDSPEIMGLFDDEETEEGEEDEEEEEQEKEEKEEEEKEEEEEEEEVEQEDYCVTYHTLCLGSDKSVVTKMEKDDSSLLLPSARLTQPPPGSDEKVMTGSGWGLFGTVSGGRSDGYGGASFTDVAFGSSGGFLGGVGGSGGLFSSVGGSSDGGGTGLFGSVGGSGASFGSGGEIFGRVGGGSSDGVGVGGGGGGGGDGDASTRTSYDREVFKRRSRRAEVLVEAEQPSPAATLQPRLYRHRVIAGKSPTILEAGERSEENVTSESVAGPPLLPRRLGAKPVGRLPQLPRKATVKQSFSRSTIPPQMLAPLPTYEKVASEPVAAPPPLPLRPGVRSSPCFTALSPSIISANVYQEMPQSLPPAKKRAPPPAEMSPSTAQVAYPTHCMSRSPREFRRTRDGSTFFSPGARKPALQRFSGLLRATVPYSSTPDGLVPPPPPPPPLPESKPTLLQKPQSTKTSRSTALAEMNMRIGSRKSASVQATSLQPPPPNPPAPPPPPPPLPLLETKEEDTLVQTLSVLRAQPKKKKKGGRVRPSATLRSALGDFLPPALAGSLPPSQRESLLSEMRYRTRSGKVANDVPDRKKYSTAELANKLFALQLEDGSWFLVDDTLSELLQISTREIYNNLKNVGAESLGRSTFDKVCRLVATVVVLAFLRSLAPNVYSYTLLPPFYADKTLSEKVKKALNWLKSADKLVPCICSRLALGLNWEDVARKWRTDFQFLDSGCGEVLFELW